MNFVGYHYIKIHRFQQINNANQSVIGHHEDSTIARSRLTDAEFRTALARLGDGETLKSVVASLPIGEPAFRWRYKKMFGRPLRLCRKRPPDFIAPSDPAVLAYMAGIIDGEGWITVNAKKNRAWTVAFANTDKTLIDFFAAHGGRVYRRFDGSFRKGTLGSVKPQWTWGLHRANNVLAFLDAIRPYLVVKHARADECTHDLRRRLALHLEDLDAPLGELEKLPSPNHTH